MNEGAHIIAALMARVESLSGFTVIYSEKGNDQPLSEHVEVSLAENADEAPEINGDRYIRQGFLVLVLRSPLGQYRSYYKTRAEAIRDHFPRGLRLTSGGNEVTIQSVDVRTGIVEAERFVQPVWVEYWSYN